MARFYGEIKGKARSKATREGDAESGIEAHIRGWNVGIEVVCLPKRDSGLDRCEVYLTGGSHTPSRLTRLSVVEEDPRGELPHLVEK